MRRFEKLANRLSKGELPISSINYAILQIEELNAYEDFAMMQTLGFPLVKTSENYATLQTRLTLIEEQKFCFVDIETNGNDTNSAQIIELGAIMIQNGKEIDRFESLVNADDIPTPIAQLTGIKVEDLKDAPSLSSVLEKFRLFIKDAVFVAHNVKFDYNFISDSLLENGFGPLLNRKLCTIDLAQKTIKAERYGLEYLKEILELKDGNLHRAIWDAYYCKEIFLESLQNLPPEVFTTEELIEFSNPTVKKLKKKKKKKRTKPRQRIKSQRTQSKDK